MKEKTLKVLIVERNKEPYEAEIDSGLESMQKIVGGYIQAVYPFEDDCVALICAEEGKILGYKPNRPLVHPDFGIYDIVCGTFFLCSAPPEEENFCSLTKEQIRKYTEHFKL